VDEEEKLKKKAEKKKQKKMVRAYMKEKKVLLPDYHKPEYLVVIFFCYITETEREASAGKIREGKCR